MEEVKKRKYASRKEEFYGFNIEQLLAMVKETATELKKVAEEQKTAKTDENELRRKDLNNRRIRIYTRLRKLGYSAQAMRSKKEEPAAPAPAAPAPVVEQPKVEAPPATT